MQSVVRFVGTDNQQYELPEQYCNKAAIMHEQ